MVCSAENWDGDSECDIRVRFSLADVVVIVVVVVLVLWIIDGGLRVELVSVSLVSKCWPA